MSTIIICAVLALICIYAVISYTKRLKNGCCGSGGEIKIKPAEIVERAGYEFEGMEKRQRG